ncbi:MAG: hypothetical protein GY754_06965 [bacterium]|nr:hypothetical protein [bacterium]
MKKSTAGGNNSDTNQKNIFFYETTGIEKRDTRFYEGKQAGLFDLEQDYGKQYGNQTERKKSEANQLNRRTRRREEPASHFRKNREAFNTAVSSIIEVFGGEVVEFDSPQEPIYDLT